MVIGAMDFFSLWFGECVNYCWFICQFQWVALNKLNSHSNRWRVPINTSYRLYYYEWCKKKIWFSLNHRKKNAMSRKPSKKGPRENTHTHQISIDIPTPPYPYGEVFIEHRACIIIKPKFISIAVFLPANMPHNFFFHSCMCFYLIF